MLNLFRKLLKPTLREQLEDGVRAALRRYSDRQVAPGLRIYVSTDLVPEGLDPALWARDEGEHQRRFALQWAEDNSVPRAGLRVEVVLLDTKREFAFVKPLGLDGKESESREASSGVSAAAGRAAAPRRAPEEAWLEIDAPEGREPLHVTGELILGRRAEGSGSFTIPDRYMSGRHARLHLTGGRLFVTDLDSKNRTFVNDAPIPPHEQIPVGVGDRIRMGNTTLRVMRVGA